MTDKELLELAAKAAGIDIEFSVFKDESFICFHSGGDCWDSEWSPLTDDGDALRLAVKLKISFYIAETTIKAVEVGWFDYDVLEWSYIQETFDIDQYAATRRAIVRAAAEIGRSM